MGFDGVFRKVKGLFFVILCFVVFRLGLLILPFAELDDFQSRQYSTRILDRNGEIIQILPLEGGLRREFSSISEINEALQKQFIKEEDKRFYFHFGIDPIAIGRAIIQNIQGKRKVSGASTITMQLARIISPSKKRNLWAKIKDSVNATRIEGKLSKKRILELYLNNIPFGKNTEGVTSAARTFFSKSINELTAEEIAVLAVIPRNPNLYNNLEKQFSYPFEMPHYVRFLKNSGIFQQQSEIKLPADLRLQHFTEEKVAEALMNTKNSRIDNAAVVVLDTKSGDVVAWAGSEGWNDEKSGGQIDGVLNKMQPGSSMKPFLYCLALDSGFSPNTVLADVPMEFGNKNLYIPHNFNNRYNGPVRFRQALASSLNIPAVFLLEKLSVKKYLETLEKLGFDSLKENSRGLDAAERFDLSLALGGGEVTLKELTDAFRVFANDGKVLDAEKGVETEVFSKDSARIICSILSDKNARSMGFGYSQTFETAYPSIFKTGTSNQYQNIVALGSTKNFTVGVWMGNFNGNTVIGKTGSSLPAYIAKSILDFLEKDTAVDSLLFEEPENFVKRKICSLSGKKPSRYCPLTVFEYIKNGEDFKECDFHREDGTVIFPVEYQRYLKTEDSSDIKIDYGFESLQIKSPKDGSIFYFDNSKKNLRQFVPFEAIGGVESEAELFIDSADGKKKVEVLERPFIFNIPISEGEHKITIKCGEESCSVLFSVK